ncbi:BQ2448_2443 [Microbotryum intermedium]|uniref:BQ2448_2443 protein n=1 Tax=Microbotryum intermedium TaxID=269621 RepID=A0A238FBN5_9BASI|nr:BQ2448_2443 [Microbotryum intermedium]
MKAGLTRRKSSHFRANHRHHPPSISGWIEEGSITAASSLGESLETMSDARVALHMNASGGVGSQLSVPNLPSAGSTLSVALDNLRGTVEKRIATLQYLKRAHGGKLYWFNTVLLTPELVKAQFEHGRMRARTTRFAVLGMSLSAILDIAPAQDFLKSLLSLVQEFDSMPDDRFDRNKNPKTLFRGNTRNRKGVSLAGSDFIGLQEGGDASNLFMPNIPFELDYNQVFITTCDLLVEIYQKILAVLGPSSSGSAAQPQPTASSAASTTSTSTSSRLIPPGSERPSPAAAGLSPALADVVVKIDARLKKIIVMVSKEFDTCARAAIKNELNALSGGGDWAQWGGDEGA